MRVPDDGCPRDAYHNLNIYVYTMEVILETLHDGGCFRNTVHDGVYNRNPSCALN